MEIYLLYRGGYMIKSFTFSCLTARQLPRFTKEGDVMKKGRSTFAAALSCALLLTLGISCCSEKSQAREDLPENWSVEPPEYHSKSLPATMESLTFPAMIEGKEYRLEAMVYRPKGADKHPLIVFSHGRNGKNPPRDPSTINWYQSVCLSLASEGYAVVYFVRRGYGNSEGEDSELLDTAVLSGLEAAKDYRAAVEYWSGKEFVLPGKVVLMGQSQGGWSVLACASVPIEGVVGVVNISGGTNYLSMGSGRINGDVQDHWVAGCGELGATARVPSQWIYSENDKSISGPTAERMFIAYTGAGAKANMLMLPPFGNDGHGIVSNPVLFMGSIMEFFSTMSF